MSDLRRDHEQGLHAPEHGGERNSACPVCRAANVHDDDLPAEPVDNRAIHLRD